MIIFVVSKNPKRAAKYMVDQHVSKIPTEAVQALSCAVKIFDPELFVPYKTPKSRLNNPTTEWLLRSASNYSWAWKYAEALSICYWEIYGKKKGNHIKSYLKLQYLPREIEIPDIGLTNFPLKIYGESDIATVRKYYSDKLKTQKGLRAEWSGQNPPYWLENSL